jgi:hypothetical protein
MISVLIFLDLFEYFQYSMGFYDSVTVSFCACGIQGPEKYLSL